MPNYALLATGHQAVLATAVALPSVGVANPIAAAVPSGEGLQVVITALAANTIPIYYGPAGVTDATGAELGPGESSPPMKLNNLNQIYVIASTTGAVVSYAVTNL
jgi:hypothetical protein